MNHEPRIIWITGEGTNIPITQHNLVVGVGSIRLSRKIMDAARLKPNDKIKFGYEDANTLHIQFAEQGINIANYSGCGDGSLALLRIRKMLAPFGYSISTGRATAICNASTRSIDIKIQKKTGGLIH